MSRKTYPVKKVNGIKKRLHRIVIEEKLGRLLQIDEHVYHIDGDPKNNNIENLIVIKKNYDK